MIEYAVLGFGARGQVYAGFLKQEGARLVAVCDINPGRFSVAKSEFALTDGQCYADEAHFFAQGKLADLLIISTLDQEHHRNAAAAIRLGYDILLEKPLANTLEDCLDLYRLAEKHGTRIYVCYVLRFAPFFAETKKLIDSGRLGNIATMQFTENIGYWHYAHSFVRGNWRNARESSPAIVAKCCHDLDIISWFAGRDPVSVSSMGGTMLFRPGNAPEGCAEYCYCCPHSTTCVYENLHFYQRYPWWLQQVGWYDGDPEDKEAIAACLRNESNPYARCVFRCDNDVADQQVVNIEFEGGMTAHLTMTAFSRDCYRSMHFYGSAGEVYGDMLENKLHYNIFGKEQGEIMLDQLGGLDGHGGGDALLIRGLIEAMRENHCLMHNTIREGITSHLIGFTAERSRQAGGKRLKIPGI